MSKSELVRNYIKNEQWKEALREARNFRIGVSREQRSTMARAYECIVHRNFYLSLGYNLEEKVNEGISVLKAIML